jgi:ParB-like chromosome segregation protein Spo0J
MSGYIVAGHARLEAAKVLNLAAVPVDAQPFASEADELAYLLADNRIAELADLQTAALKDLLEELDTGGFDMDLTGYSEEERERMATQYFVSEEEKHAKAVAEQVAGEKNWQPQHDGADKRAEKIKERIDSLQKKSPEALQKGKLVIISPDAAEAVVLVDDSLKDVIDELMRYAESGTPSPLAALMEARHPL